MAPRCLYVPTETGFCTNCGGLPEYGECPRNGEPLTYEDSTTAARAIGDFAWALAAAAASALGLFAAAIRFAGDLLKATVDDDRR